MTQNALELEKSIVGLAIYDSSQTITVLDVLKPEHFYDEKLGKIWETILKISAKGETVDNISVIMDLKTNNLLEYCGGVKQISKLTDLVGHGTTPEIQSRKIIEKYLLRKMYVFCENMKNKTLLHNADCFDIAEEFGTLITNVTDNLNTNQVKDISAHRDEILKDCEEALTNGNVNGIPIRLKQLHNWTNGWRKGHLIVIAARPGMGKTASAIEFAEYPASLGIPIGVFSLEMTAKELTGRVMSIYSNISAQRINNNICDQDEIRMVRDMTTDLVKLPIYIDDSPYLTMYQLRLKAMKLKLEKKIEMLVIDYLQLMSGEGGEGNREQKLSKISRGLKSLAKELEIPILALAQLNRESTKRKDQKPIAADIRECGAIEQDADMIIFPHRPEYLKIESYFLGDQEISSRDLIVFIIEKYRGGQIGDIAATWTGRTMSISDYNQI